MFSLTTTTGDIPIMTAVIRATRVIDTDAHVTEPADLWTSRLPQKFRADAPTIEHVESTGSLHWRIGKWLSSPIGNSAIAGWPEYYPSVPHNFDEMDPACFDPKQRLARMDEYGVTAQVLYPNVLGFEAGLFMSMDNAFSTACVRAYNDFITEWASVDPNRLLPMTMLPVWDVDASVAEIHRCHEMGHRGVLFAGHLERIGLPKIYETHWDPIYAATQEIGSSINLHIGFSTLSEEEAVERSIAKQSDFLVKDIDWAMFLKGVVLTFANNMSTISDLILGGVCDRFPTLRLVSAESGFGYIPYLSEILDWQWRNNGGGHRMPGRLLPSEYLHRQIFATFWFEKDSLQMLPAWQDNVMFETDFPHPTSLTPGPASVSGTPTEMIARNFVGVPEDVTRKVLFDNAARLYGVEA
jgi:predicted TIM-barrel fold metal-dependent hydrolase